MKNWKENWYMFVCKDVENVNAMVSLDDLLAAVQWKKGN